MLRRNKTTAKTDNFVELLLITLSQLWSSRVATIEFVGLKLGQVLSSSTFTTFIESLAGLPTSTGMVSSQDLYQQRRAGATGEGLLQQVSKTHDVELETLQDAGATVDDFLPEEPIDYSDEDEDTHPVRSSNNSPQRTPVQRKKSPRPRLSNSESPEPVLPYKAAPGPSDSNPTATKPVTPTRSPSRPKAPEIGTQEPFKVPADWQDGQFSARLAFSQCIPTFDNGRFPTKPEWVKTCKNCGLPLGPGHITSFTCNRLCFICVFRNRPGAHVANCHQGKPCDSHRHAEGLYRKYAKKEQGYKECYPSEPQQSQQGSQRGREASPRRGGHGKRAFSRREPRQTYANEPPRGRESPRRERDPSPPRRGAQTFRPDSSVRGYDRQRSPPRRERDPNPPRRGGPTPPRRGGPTPPRRGGPTNRPDASQGGRPQKVVMDKDLADELLENSKKRVRDSRDDEDHWDWVCTSIQGKELFKNSRTGDVSVGHPSNLPYFKKRNMGGAGL
ncbi:hypothetical protein EG328_005904 [Venturia inaequalis]|uniref:Uncharacterized protein n=1 Tax=Venturia inaequalis TaxID=5025 RepID=A0A8H3UJ97_VENIN|nr:hypothetical protein EG328_005904 [Venturia inaequalis]